MRRTNIHAEKPLRKPYYCEKRKESKGNVTLALYKTENSYFKGEGHNRSLAFSFFAFYKPTMMTNSLYARITLCLLLLLMVILCSSSVNAQIPAAKDYRTLPELREWYNATGIGRAVRMSYLPNFDVKRGGKMPYQFITPVY